MGPMNVRGKEEPAIMTSGDEWERSWREVTQLGRVCQLAWTSP